MIKSKFALIASLLLVITTQAFALDAREPNCKAVAKQALVKTLKVKPSQVNYLGGAAIGDGGLAFEFFIFSVVTGNEENVTGYQVRFATDSADMCDQTYKDANIQKVQGL